MASAMGSPPKLTRGLGGPSVYVTYKRLQGFLLLKLIIPESNSVNNCYDRRYSWCESCYYYNSYSQLTLTSTHNSQSLIGDKTTVR